MCRFKETKTKKSYCANLNKKGPHDNNFSTP